MHNLEACLLGQRDACPQGRVRHKLSCAPTFWAAHLHGDFLGASKNLVSAKQAEKDHPIVENNDTHKLERAEWFHLASSDATPASRSPLKLTFHTLLPCTHRAPHSDLCGREVNQYHTQKENSKHCFAFFSASQKCALQLVVK